MLDQFVTGWLVEIAALALGLVLLGAVVGWWLRGRR